ncbi:hypothetical protein WR25_05994 [Diploscapter pachys]|uniref:Cation-transporting ATPase n=1 Tax=Diploscapter pachys TaxID=2018661 RepID=A0A2A2LQ96_9BILA|nr:hypothetical protein WR25_05994 [Diploscapter pachys]
MTSTGTGKKQPDKDLNRKAISTGDSVIYLQPYEYNLVREILFWTLCICTVGIFAIVCSWNPKIMIYVRYSPSTHVSATQMLVTDAHDIDTLRPVRIQEDQSKYDIPNADGTYRVMSTLRLFTFRKLKYVWLEERNDWVTPSDIDSQIPVHRLLDNVDTGLNVETHKRRMNTYGENHILVKLKPILTLVFKEAISPFYIFQICSVTLWFVDQYMYYAIVIIIISLISISVDVYGMRTEEKKLKKMIDKTSQLNVMRDGKVFEVNSIDGGGTQEVDPQISS